jgi:hypothetical protein
VDEYGLDAHVQTRNEVESAVWDQERQHYTVLLNDDRPGLEQFAVPSSTPRGGTMPWTFPERRSSSSVPAKQGPRWY